MSLEQHGKPKSNPIPPWASGVPCLQGLDERGITPLQQCSWHLGPTAIIPSLKKLQRSTEDAGMGVLCHNPWGWQRGLLCLWQVQKRGNKALTLSSSLQRILTLHLEEKVPLEPALARPGGAAANASSCQDWVGIMPDPSSELPVLSEGPVQPQPQRRRPWLGELGSSGAAGSGLGGFAGGEGRISEL